MKLHYFRLFFISCSFLFFNAAYAQQNSFYTLLTTDPVNVPYDFVPPAPSNADTAAAVCNGVNTFWGIEDVTGLVKEFDITNNVITYTGNYIPSCPGYSLCISNNLNGGVMSPTFYTSQNTNASYWNGGNAWVTAPGSAASNLYNGAGNGNNLYFQSSVATSTEIIKYDGCLFTTIFSTSKIMGCADIAVDNNGNFIFVSFSSLTGMSDSLFIISHAGQILNRYPFVVNVNNAYGCFLLNSVFYLALGAGHTITPNSLIPVTFTGSSANIGTPVNLPAGTVLTYDLASCNPGTLLGTNTSAVSHEFSLSPNPASDYITIFGIKVNNCMYSIYDVSGNEVIPPRIIENENTTIDISTLKSGIYFIGLKTKDSTLHRYFCKM